MGEIKVGFDVDGVIANYTQRFLDYAHEFAAEVGATLPSLPRIATDVVTWDFNGHRPLWNAIAPSTWTNAKWWMQIKRYDEACAVMLQKLIRPTAYVTARHIPSEVTRDWIKKNFFPDAPVVSVTNSADKLEVVKSLGLTHFVDDLVTTADMLHDAGLTSYLLSRPYNVNEKTRAIRIRSIGEMQLD